MSQIFLPADHRPFTDKYFLHASTILKAEHLNPRVTIQVFVRSGPGRVGGMGEVVDILLKYSRLEKNGGTVHVLPEGSTFESMEPLIHIEGNILDFIELETMYLGVLSSGTTLATDGRDVNLKQISSLAAELRNLVPDRALTYFGARHWRFDRDEDITRAVLGQGWDAASTDKGAQAAGRKHGVGTIPHAMVLCFAHRYGREKATAEATRAFHKHIELTVPRIALVDTFNREIDDSLATARDLGGGLWGVRLDTAGQNVPQGGDPASKKAFIGGTGVTVSGALALRRALNEQGFRKTRIVLSGDFGNPEKVKTFLEAERAEGMRIFDSLGVGGLFKSRHATADIVRIEGQPMAKTGRQYVPSDRMIQAI